MLKEKGINLTPQEYLDALGLKLYTKITEVVQEEIEEITEDDCVSFIFNLVINRTFEGYHTEIKTIYGQLEETLNIPIKPAPDKWDRLYNIDFYIEVNKKYIGFSSVRLIDQKRPENSWESVRMG